MGGSTKQALLQALSAAEGAYISGQQLAEALGVSPARLSTRRHRRFRPRDTRWIPPRAGATGWQAVIPSAPRRWAPTPPPFISTTRCKAPT